MRRIKVEPNSDAKTVASPEKEACLSEILDDVVEYLSSWKKDFQEGLNSDDVIRLQAVLALINAISVSKGVAEIQLLNLTDSESWQKNERHCVQQHLFKNQTTCVWPGVIRSWPHSTASC